MGFRVKCGWLNLPWALIQIRGGRDDTMHNDDGTLDPRVALPHSLDRGAGAQAANLLAYISRFGISSGWIYA
jgi:hypothetical protein